MSLDLPPLYDDLTFHGPLSERRADALAAFVAGIPSGLVVDIGCGWAETLLRVLAANSAVEGCGIDSNADDIAHGKALAQARGLSERVGLVVGDASKEAPATADAVICMGSSQVWGDPEAVEMDYSAALTALRGMVPVGARVLYGEGIWSQPPTDAATRALGGSKSEFVTMAELVGTVVAHGFRPYSIEQATLEDGMPSSRDTTDVTSAGCWLTRPTIRSTERLLSGPTTTAKHG